MENTQKTRKKRFPNGLLMQVAELTGLPRSTVSHFAALTPENAALIMTVTEIAATQGKNAAFDYVSQERAKRKTN